MPVDPLYTPLDPSRQEIRLLEVISTDAQITCRTRIASLNAPDRPQFCAVSYVWGDPSATKIVTVDSTERHITPSLDSALRCSHYHWKESFPNRDASSCLLWADALCINQDDLQEKSSQIPLMGKVFSSAETTFCCLDPGVPASQIGLAFAIFKAMVEGVDSSDYDLNRDLNRWDNQPETANIDWLVSNPTIREHCTGTEESVREADIPANIAMDAFKQVTYWTRVWILQEMVLSNDPLLVHDSQSMRLDSFLRLALWGKATSKLRRPKTLNWTFGKTLPFLCPNRLARLVPFMRESTKNRQLRPGSWDRAFEDRALHMAVLDGACLAATEPKDHIYALMGVVGLDTKSDYTSSKSVSSVYIDFCGEFLNSCARLRSYAVKEARSRASFLPPICRYSHPCHRRAG
jgi:hypothetical protein